MPGLIPFRPFHNLDKFFDDDWFGRIAWPRMSEPAVDVYQTKDSVVVEMPLAGVKPEDVKISIEDDMLHVTGSTEVKKEEKDTSYWRKEIRRGSFERVIPLPVEVKANQATAESKDGMLMISLPKAAKTKPKKIDIKIRTNK